MITRERMDGDKENIELETDLLRLLEFSPSEI